MTRRIILKSSDPLIKILSARFVKRPEPKRRITVRLRKGKSTA